MVFSGTEALWPTCLGHTPSSLLIISDKWQQSAKEAEKAATHSRDKAETLYNVHAHNLPEIRIISNVAIQDSKDKAIGHLRMA